MNDQVGNLALRLLSTEINMIQASLDRSKKDCNRNLDWDRNMKSSLAILEAQEKIIDDITEGVVTWHWIETPENKIPASLSHNGFLLEFDQDFSEEAEFMRSPISP
jgi:hypothetical protein